MDLGNAHHISERIVGLLKPWCRPHRILTGGSIRRREPVVGDIEVIALPLQMPGEKSLFGEIKSWVYAPDFVERVGQLGPLQSGDPLRGRHLKIDILNKKGEFLIKLDLFLPQEHDFWRIAAIRTGSANYSAKIASAWVRKGWVGTQDGLRLQSQCREVGKNKWVCNVKDPHKPPAWADEREFFAWLEMDYIAPTQRK